MCGLVKDLYIGAHLIAVQESVGSRDTKARFLCPFNLSHSAPIKELTEFGLIVSNPAQLQGHRGLVVRGYIVGAYHKDTRQSLDNNGKHRCNLSPLILPDRVFLDTYPVGKLAAAHRTEAASPEVLYNLSVNFYSFRHTFLLVV